MALTHEAALVGQRSSDVQYGRHTLDLSSSSAHVERLPQFVWAVHAAPRAVTVGSSALLLHAATKTKKRTRIMTAADGSDRSMRANRRFHAAARFVP